MRSERGDIVAIGLLKVVAVLLVLFLVLFELGAVVVNHYQVDNIGSDAVRAGLTALRNHGPGPAVETAVETSVSSHEGASLQGMTVDKHRVTVTVSKQAHVLFLDRISPLQSIVEAQVTKSASGLQ